MVTSILCMNPMASNYINDQGRGDFEPGHLFSPTNVESTPPTPGQYYPRGTVSACPSLAT